MQAWTNGVSERVLDSSALLAVIKEEPGRERVESALEAGVAMSVVNLGEVVSRLADQERALPRSNPSSDGSTSPITCSTSGPPIWWVCFVR